ncbi:MAG: hypothetical protein ABI376_10255 [Caulobacteraceae bacterium]
MTGVVLTGGLNPGAGGPCEVKAPRATSPSFRMSDRGEQSWLEAMTEAKDRTAPLRTLPERERVRPRAIGPGPFAVS